MKKMILGAAILFSGSGSTLLAQAEVLPRFPQGSVWRQNISNAPLHAQSSQMISRLNQLGGFGFGRMQIDFGFHLVRADSSAPVRTIVGYPFGNYFSPDCEAVGTTMPVPLNSAIQAVNGLSCDNSANDCHLLVVQDHFLYEAYHANQCGAEGLESQCLAIWDLNVIYPESGRGDHCTSADAAGFPIAPLLFNADEVAASLAVDANGDGDLGHAIRFILPNARIATDPSLGGVGGRLYVRPASHAGGPSGPVDTVPYGVRMRLRSDFPLTGYNPAARVILNNMKRFGIVLSDGGNVALTAESDLYTTTSWAELGVNSRIFDLTPGATDVTVTDFEIIDTGSRIGETFNCVRNEIETIFLEDGFEQLTTS